MLLLLCVYSVTNGMLSAIGDAAAQLIPILVSLPSTIYTVKRDQRRRDRGVDKMGWHV